MNDKLYGNLIFELSHQGRKGYSLPKNEFGKYAVNELPEAMRRKEDAEMQGYVRERSCWNYILRLVDCRSCALDCSTCGCSDYLEG